MKSKSNTLTGRQRLWAEHYIVCLNAKEAARLAGYKATKENLGMLGHRNLHNPKIKAYLDVRFSEAVMAANECMHRLGEQARADFGDLEEALKEKTVDKMIAKARAKGVSHLIRKISETATGITIELHSPQKALELIGRFHSLFVDKVEHSGSIDVTQLSNEELETLAGRG